MPRINFVRTLLLLEIIFQAYLFYQCQLQNRFKIHIYLHVCCVYFYLPYVHIIMYNAYNLAKIKSNSKLVFS